MLKVFEPNQKMVEIRTKSNEPNQMMVKDGEKEPKMMNRTE
jgi:hypothetical protein